MSTPDVRARLAEEQARLVRALVGGGAMPAGFDEERIRLTARSLLNKRLREVSRAWPALARCLGEAFDGRFAHYAYAHPPPTKGGPLADGRAFAATLCPAELDDESRLEVLRADLHHRRLPIRTRWLPRSGTLVIGVRLPWLGVRLVSLRLRQ